MLWARICNFPVSRQEHSKISFDLSPPATSAARPIPARRAWFGCSQPRGSAHRAPAAASRPERGATCKQRRRDKPGQASGRRRGRTFSSPSTKKETEEVGAR